MKTNVRRSHFGQKRNIASLVAAGPITTHHCRLPGCLAAWLTGWLADWRSQVIFNSTLKPHSIKRPFSASFANDYFYVALAAHSRSGMREICACAPFGNESNAAGESSSEFDLINLLLAKMVGAEFSDEMRPNWMIIHSRDPISIAHTFESNSLTRAFE